MYELNWNKIEQVKEYEILIKEVIKTCFEEEKLEKTKLYINIILTDKEEIKNINKQYRNIDKETDVLSFPMFEKEDIETLKKKSKWVVEEVLGDIIIAMDIITKQAKEYGHSTKRELAYMLVHGFYHLMGYDHMTEEEKKEMRQKEENILEKLQIKRA